MLFRSQLIPSLTRRRVLQGTLSGVAGLTAWQPGWPWHRTATAQHREPRGQMTWAIQLNIAPTWFDPAETPGIMSPYIFLYALHDALVKPMPAHPMAPSLATAWHESSDGLTYDFALRQGVTFHNGDPFTAVAYLRLADKYLGLLASRLRGVNQPVIRTRRGFQPLVTHRWPAFERKVSAPNLSPPT